MGQLNKGELLGLGFFVWVSFLVAGLLILVAWQRGIPPAGHLWTLVGLSSLPWVVILANGLQATAPVAQPAVPRQRKDYQLVEVYRHDVPTFEGIDVEDLEYFVRTITETRDWTQRAWRGTVMPSGVRCDNKMHRKMCDILERAGFIVGRKPRSSGRLLVRRPKSVLTRLGLVQSRSFQ